MTILKRYIIEDVRTGFVFMEPQGRSGRGGSHMNPEPIDDLSKPRLFPTERAAKCFIGSWCQGRFIAHRSGGGEWDDYEEDITVQKVMARDKKNLRIVEVPVHMPDPTLEQAAYQSLDPHPYKTDGEYQRAVDYVRNVIGTSSGSFNELIDIANTVRLAVVQPESRLLEYEFVPSIVRVGKDHRKYWLVWVDDFMLMPFHEQKA